MIYKLAPSRPAKFSEVWLGALGATVSIRTWGEHPMASLRIPGARLGHEQETEKLVHTGEVNHHPKSEHVDCVNQRNWGCGWWVSRRGGGESLLHLFGSRQPDGKRGASLVAGRSGIVGIAQGWSKRHLMRMNNMGPVDFNRAYPYPLTLVAAWILRDLRDSPLDS